MELSMHKCTDRYGYQYSVTVMDYDSDIVVFSCKPELKFDINEYGLKGKLLKKHYGNYGITYEVKEGALYLTELRFESRPSLKVRKILNTEPFKPYPTLNRYFYTIDHLPVDYTGIWSIGKDFDFNFWQGDEKAKPTPFCPEVYKQNGFIRFENGRVVEIEIRPRNSKI